MLEQIFGVEQLIESKSGYARYEPHDSPEHDVSKAAVIRLTTSLSDTLSQG
ncbi:hypothetical protein GCM10011409_24530 [Lentibacillus populi]|uniref:Uncharacterized protein n=1 Tax=Lentibacillus populi TaxID=1827502 RepID=A0A9W5TXY9_9BACI|nr:hypothetical protein GCM10011409_24530 [Lentibacillus populi]